MASKYGMLGLYKQRKYTMRHKIWKCPYFLLLRQYSTNGHVILKAMQNSHVILKVTYRTNTGYILNTKLALFRVMHRTESLISAQEQLPNSL